MEKPSEHRQFGGRIILVAGLPCSGKGTQCKLLARESGFLHISLGDVVRKAVEDASELGRQAKQFLDQGSLLPDDLAAAFVLDQLQKAGHDSPGCLLDGFPRTAGQAQKLIDMGIVVDRMVLFEVADSVLVARAPGRRIDPETGDIYHLQHVPPPSEIGARLVRRDYDGDQDTFLDRLKSNHERIREVLPFFKNKITTVDANAEPGAVLAAVKKCLAETIRPQDDDEWPEDEPMLAPSSGMQPYLTVTPTVDAANEGGARTVVVNVHMPDEQSRVPVDVCCVIDISGSMGQSATPANDESSGEDLGLSVLDIVKHAVKAVMAVLQDCDRMSLVAFDDKAETVFALREMSANGRDQATEALNSLRPKGQTNLWDGIHAGMESLREEVHGSVGRRKTLLVLTDGQPNISPPRGHQHELRLYRDSYPDFSFQINTFGFGYDLDSELLTDLACEGNGTFAFIPDAVIVGTTFVNSVANALSTWAQSTQVHLMLEKGASFNGPVTGAGQVTEASWGRVLNLGPLQLGQDRNFAVPLLLPPGEEPYLEVVLKYSIPGMGSQQTNLRAADRTATADAAVAELRSQVVEVIFRVVREAAANRGKAAQQTLEALSGRLVAATSSCSDQKLVALRADVEGRVAKALKGKDRFNRWGKHYLRALARAHQLQMCTNFMDPGLQIYGGTLFRDLRAQGDDAFLSLPAPTPAQDETSLPCDRCGQMTPFCNYAEHASICGTGRQAATPAAQPSAPRPPAADMQTYYAGSGGG
mmetsp:Transcript_38941/g.77305  ORF Transcript_38941/g.77305 Transcript_38941/m.77305 type:complete len:758 (+) Transcript_38941:62-2335(+)|eukprot:CAMPEP_0172663926 /NCGR_PEP_ID=MMETSP1074-20121228/6253_1 /TAXON_ID=2916 /ORGANISM="Ceratium fusus, Strain PA161109" /LENGTH=757 /DNA_ID=CAMNT_0013479999 /DNA_START=51 /DNA_END=2324 /DNA_ORIENTATION=-